MIRGCFFLIGLFIPAVSLSGADLWRADVFPEALKDSFATSSKQGITPHFYFSGTYLANPIGGLNQNAAYTHEMIFGATFHFEELVGWKGATLKVSGAQSTGRNLSDGIGNVFTVSQSYVTPTAMFYELFYQQKLFDDFLEFKVGRLTAADDFVNLPAFGLQVSGGINGNPASLFLNSNFTSSPNATWGAALKVQPSLETYASYGIYQATNRLGLVAYHGLDFSIRSNDGILMFLETGWNPNFGEIDQSPPEEKETGVAFSNGLPGNYKVGGYFSNLPLASATNPGISETNTFGLYLLGQQTIWQSPKNPNVNFALWGGLTYAPQTNVSPMPLMAFGGSVWQGLIPWRDQDQFLFTWMTGAFSNAFAADPGQASSHPTAETVFDVSYVFNITPEIYFQPDIQYIIQPNGTRTPNALVVGVQFGCNF